ncbi:hypothetical protein, partial [Aestuariibacter sp. GS-14]|uniref:hypothetical protein n=1 Tax=Aestuariibacter sp. GS-14 TaxID=2590670 RepID=UPI001C641CB8
HVTVEHRPRRLRGSQLKERPTRLSGPFLFLPVNGLPEKCKAKESSSRKVQNLTPVFPESAQHLSGISANPHVEANQPV